MLFLSHYHYPQEKNRFLSLVHHGIQDNSTDFTLSIESSTSSLNSHLVSYFFTFIFFRIYLRVSWCIRKYLLKYFLKIKNINSDTFCWEVILILLRFISMREYRQSNGIRYWCISILEYSDVIDRDRSCLRIIHYWL